MSLPFSLPIKFSLLFSSDLPSFPHFQHCDSHPLPHHPLLFIPHFPQYLSPLFFLLNYIITPTHNSFPLGFMLPFYVLLFCLLCPFYYCPTPLLPFSPYLPLFFPSFLLPFPLPLSFSLLPFINVYISFILSPFLISFYPSFHQFVPLLFRLLSLPSSPLLSLPPFPIVSPFDWLSCLISGCKTA